jgi:hypothetical protein
LILSLPQPAPVLAKDPFTSYFSRLFDETRPEIAVGKILLEGFFQEVGSSTQIASYSGLDKALGELSKGCPRNQLPFAIYVIDSPIPAEIPFPGGPIIITKGTLDLVKSPLERDFILARNIMHISLRHPMMILKKEGLYGRILRIFKKSAARFDPVERQKVLRDYIKAAKAMDQIKADKEGLALLPQGPESRTAAQDYLVRWSKALFPTVPWESSDLEPRIKALSTLP